MNQALYFDHGRGRRRFGEELMMRAGRLCEARDIGDEHPGADYILHREPHSLERHADVEQRLACLHVHLATADHQAPLIGGCGTRYRDELSGFDGSRIGSDRFPRRAAGNAHKLRHQISPSRERSLWERLRYRVTGTAPQAPARWISWAVPS